MAVIAILFGSISESQAQSIQNWSDPVNLSNSGSASDPILVVDGGGILHVLWIDEFDGYKYSASADGLTWSAPKIVRYPFSPDDFQPVFLVDPRGPIYMFWLTEKNDLRYAQSQPANFDNPGAWGPVITLDTSVYDFDIALDLESGFHVDYIRNPASPAKGPAGVYYRRSQSGSAWSNAVVLYESQYFRSLEPENAHVRIEASNGSVYAVWDDRSLKRVFMARSNDSGIGWNAPVELIVPQANLGFKTPINIEIGKFNNNILLIWQVGDPGIRCTQFSQWSADGGESWTDPVSSLPLDFLKLHTHRRPPTELSLCRSAISCCYVWLGDINRATMLLTKIPEAKSDLYVYQWWWETHERTELAEKASMISLELER